MDRDRIRSSYYSVSGYRIWGGTSRVPAQVNHLKWISVGLMVGVAVIVATYLATRG